MLPPKPPLTAEMVANMDATVPSQPLLQNRKRNFSTIKQIDYHKVLIQINLKLFRALGVYSSDSEEKNIQNQLQNKYFFLLLSLKFYEVIHLAYVDVLIRSCLFWSVYVKTTFRKCLFFSIHLLILILYVISSNKQKNVCY